MKPNLKKPEELARAEFHWKVWESQAKAFALRATATTVALVTLLLFATGSIKKLDFAFIKVELAENWQASRLLALGAALMSWFLLAWISFGFVDLMRHRLPDDLEDVVHNNHLKIRKDKPNTIKPALDLRPVGHGLYKVVFFGYLLILGGAAAWISILVLYPKPLAPK